MNKVLLNLLGLGGIMEQLQILSNAIAELTATVNAALPQIAKLKANQTDVATVVELTKQINAAKSAIELALK